MASGDDEDHKVFSKVCGDQDKCNDVVYFPVAAAKYNLIFFPGDVQDYPEEMVKHPINKKYLEWNLVNTGRLLRSRFSNEAHVFIVKADSMHLKTFAKFTNFLKSNDFGSPVAADDDENVEQNVNGLLHLSKLYSNVTSKLSVVRTLPVIVCGFSKGCIVLNELCQELLNFQLSFGLLDEEAKTCLNNLVSVIRHVIWLDGGHSGTANAWPTENNVILNLAKLNLRLYVYVTPYQISENNPKKWAVVEYRMFTSLIRKYFTKNFKINSFYLNQENVYDDRNYELEAHFQIFNMFDCALIEA